MQRELQVRAESYIENKHRRSIWQRVVSVLACLVVFCTTYALILPAITQEHAYCGLEEHTHGAECYGTETVYELSCTAQSLGADRVIHTHTEECYADGVLECTLEEVPAHTHTDACYEATGHVHTDECHDQGGNLICGQEEKTLVCGREEVILHTHTAACGSDCQLPVVIEHTHTKECWRTETVQTDELICTRREHKHSDSCYSNRSADLEESSDWEKTLPQQLSGDWREDLIAVAKSQLGYQESKDNYEVLDDGTHKGYTRYGQWYGDKYGDWCAMFVSFCLDYAEVSQAKLPPNANCQNWIDTLRQEPYNLYHEVSSDYEPQVGDLIFFEWGDGDDRADHVGIIAEISQNGEQLQKAVKGTESGTTIRTIEGNSGDQVRYQEYEWGDSSILGYAEIPEQGQTDDEAGIALISDGAEGSNALDIVQSISTSEFVELNLYDYGSNINDMYDNNPEYWNSNSKVTSKYPGFQWNGGAYMQKSGYNRHTIDFIDFGNSMITDYKYAGTDLGLSTTSKVITITNNGTNPYNINSIDYSAYGVTNRAIGIGLNGSITDKTWDVLSRTLKDGYPALADGTSLAYLFSNGTYAVKQNTESIDGLFQQNAETGAYEYNSRENHAQYNADENKFTLYKQIITPNFITYPFGNFLPFNDITNSGKATQVSGIAVGAYVTKMIDALESRADYDHNATAKQLAAMLGKYQDDLKTVSADGGTAWDNWTSFDAIKDYFTGDAKADHPSDDTSLITQKLLENMYNIDWDEETNFFFGMEMTMDFIQPKGGMTGYDTNGDGTPDYPMEFYFTGDDDVWAYVDGVLFLDLSGIHRHVGGKIDFVKGKVEYYYLDTEGTGDVNKDDPYQTYTFEEILKATGQSTDGLNEKGTFKDYSTHEFKFYYMERGSGSSVCRMNFNFPLLRTNTISVEKELSVDSQEITSLLGNPDYSFQILQADDQGNKTQNLFIGADVSYTVYDEEGNEVAERKTDSNGVFTIKAGQRAEFAIPEDQGKYYVRELFDPDIYEQYGKVEIKGSTVTMNNSVVLDSGTFTGVESPVKDASDGSTKFFFDNTIDSSKLGSLSVRKELTEEPENGTQPEFEFEVSLDGELLPTGTIYTVGEETRTVETDGIIRIPAGQTAVISHIIAGSSFTVRETDASRKGYIVTYTGAGSDGAATTGQIGLAAPTAVTVTNSVNGTTLAIPGHKIVINPDGQTREVSFLLEEADKTGDALSGGKQWIVTAQIQNEADFEFLLSYLEKEIAELPATYYYRMAELAYDDPDSETDSSFRRDETVYIIEVQVSKDSDGKLQADIRNRWRQESTGLTLLGEGENISFENLLLADLIIGKTVRGSQTEQEFAFTISLVDSEGDPVTGTFALMRNGSLEDISSIQFQVKEGAAESSAEITLKNDETVTIRGLPYGARWTVTETEAEGYLASYSLGEGEARAGNQAEGTVDGTTVQFVNTAAYELPESGGTGTISYRMVGIMLLLISGFLLIYQYHKHRKEVRNFS